MKRKLLISFLLLTAMGGYIQGQVKSTMVMVFKTAEGKIIPPEKLDSVKQSLGEFTYRHSTQEPGIMYLIPKNKEAQAAEELNKAKQVAMIGKPAPYFNLTDLKGKKYDLKALNGKVVVLNFWFTTCGGCIEEMPELNKIKARYSPTDVVFLALALDKAPEVKTFLKRHRFDYAIIPEASKTHKDYGVYACPVSMVIDRKGNLVMILDFNQALSNLSEDINNAIAAKAN